MGGAAVVRVECGELVIEAGQGFIGDPTDQTQRVVAGDPAFRPHVAEKTVPSIIPTTHRKPFPAVDPI
jgi:hypothetical protein